MIGNKNSSKISHMVRSHSPTMDRVSPIGFPSLSRKLGCVLLACMIGFSSAQAATAAKIVVDAGHGGSDPGAIGVNGLQEKQVNLDISLRLQGELLLRGYEVALTRQDDRYISLADRVAITNEAKADLFVSVHANSHTASSISGSLVLYHDSNYPQSDYPASDAMTALTPESKKLAQSVLRNVLLTAKLADRGLVPSAAYVVRMGQIPSILVETAFLSNPQDAAALKDPAMLQKFAVGIANGIQEVLPPAPVPKEFADLQKHWAKDAVYRLKDKGIVETDKNFFPDRPLTRAELLTMLNRKFAFGQRLMGTPKPGVNLPIFKDLPATHWASDVMYRAGALEYVDGYPDQTIRPDQSVTRAEAAVLLQRIMLLPKMDKPLTDTGFSDVRSDNWAAKAIVQLSQKGLINGVGDKLFAPDKVMTRAEMAVLIDRAK
ncbi:MAG: N-acetylmuramoyl-L-alanine amidase AmiC [Paenibacillus sp.]|nr:N-acetylmuramoyl-L-alanine amidase AmiC [Paenibacillus sp.]